MKKSLLCMLALCSVFVLTLSLAGQDLVLARNGKTNYQIVIAGSSPKNIWDGQFLAWFLEQKTGAKFAVVGARSKSKHRNAIFLGNSVALRKTIPLPFAGMKNQDHVVRSIGKDIFLYGKGYDADFYAINEFLDRCLGYRIYQRNVAPEIKKTPVLTLKPFSYKLSWALPYRMVCQSRFTDYFRGETEYAHRMARDAYGSFPNRPNKFSLLAMSPRVIQPEKREVGDAHTALRYIPSAKRAGYKGYPFLKKDYFKDHPEYFYMNGRGQRTDEYLCWSNKGMRKEFTKNIEKHFDVLGTDDVIVSVTMADGVDTCHCPECKKLKKRDGTPGAAYFDYLMELGKEFMKTHPKTIISAGFYQERQTQIPPKYAPGVKFPPNIRLEYCDIISKTNKTWDNHPDNRRAFEMLKQAAKLTSNVSVMTYYPHYGLSTFVPLVTTRVIVDNLKKLAKLGLLGNFFEFYPFNNGFSYGKTGMRYLNFADLNLYLYYRFSKYPDLDFDAEVTDFCKNVYGPAWKLVKAYHDEVLKLTCDDNKYGFVLDAKNFNKELSYLTPARIYKWQKMFDKMTELVKNSKPLYKKNVENLRRTLDFVTYYRWKYVYKAYPKYFNDAKMIRKRIGDPGHPVWGKGARNFLKTAELHIRFLGKEKPLPAPFNKIPKDRIIQALPQNRAVIASRSKVPRIVEDNDAAFGYAASIDCPNLPFRFGYHVFGTKSNFKGNRRVALKKQDIVEGKYHIYPMGEVQPTNGHCIVFFGWSWSTNYDVSQIFDFANVQAKYDCYVSLKFPKGYAGKKDELVLCDQIIFIRK